MATAFATLIRTMGAIIFDFDGTIANTFDYAVGFLAQEAGQGSLDEAQKQAYRGLSMAAMVYKLGFHWWDGPRLLFKGRRQLWQRAEPSPSFSGLAEVIKRLHEDGHSLFIVTANSVRNVRRFLRLHHLETYISKVYSSNGLGKAPALWWILRRHHLRRQSAIYVGDERLDIKAAQALDLRVVAVSWGFAARQELVDLKPTALAETPAELLNILMRLSA